VNDLSLGAAWMRGEILPIAEAKIGVTDWGLTHSDIAYDVVPVVDGAFFRLDDYLDRFAASIAAGRYRIDQGRAEIATALQAMVAASGLRNAYCAMVVARGVPRVHGSRDPRDCVNHFYAWVVPYVHVIKPDVVDSGASVWIAKQVRRIPRDSVNPLAKNYHWGDFTAGLFEAKDAGFETVVLCDHAGHVTEGPGFNAFALKGDVLVTPDLGVLAGVTRRTAMEMAQEIGLTVEERALPLEEFLEADEVFLSSSGGGVLPICQVDDRIFGNGRPGPVASRLNQLYWDWTQRAVLRTQIDYAD
jgi:branched-chain amino acid aminotransferase